jgi:hypothetical protein
MNKMTNEEQIQFIDMIAQAVIDRIEERDRINRVADMVMGRIMEFQNEEKALAEEAKRLNTPKKEAKK